MKQIETLSVSSLRPPIVAVLGHVDHGKTTLLDFIRKSDVASKEHGGITQHIGAYQVKVKSEKLKVKSGKQEIKNQEKDTQNIERLITFIDTPGHEAFDKMRSRGASVADIAILVVAADDSVKPQTEESIQQIKTANIPMIVAVNKVDLPTANIDRVKKDLARVGVQVEGFGGDVPIVPVSATAGTGVSELLDMILLVSDMGDISGDPKGILLGVVIETRLDKGKGTVATLIVKNGTLRQGMTLFEGSKEVGKVRAMFDEYGKGVFEALPSKPVEVLGFTLPPTIGTVLSHTSGVDVGSSTILVNKPLIQSMPNFLKPLEDEKEQLKLILKADTSGSLEAIVGSLSNRVTIVNSGVGDISEADILLAKSVGAIVIGFNIKAAPSVAKLADMEKVIYRTYAIIYKLLEELANVVSGLKDVLIVERQMGVGQIIAEFPFEKSRIAGTKVTSGRLARGDSVKIMREEEEVGRAKIKSVRRGKEDITKAEEGSDYGILLEPKVDFTIGDAIIAVL